MNTPRFDADLTLDEFRVILATLPPNVVPAAARPRLMVIGRIAAPGVPDETAAQRENTARATLKARGLVTEGVNPKDDTTVNVASDVVVHPLVQLSLAAVCRSEHTIELATWTPAFSSNTTVSIVGDLASIVTVTVPRPRSGGAPDVRFQTAGRVHISFGEHATILETLDELLSASAPEPTAVSPVTIAVGLAESRSIMLALARSDSAAIEQIAAVFDVRKAVPLLRTLAAPFECGARIRAYDRGVPRFTANWVQSSTAEWVGFRLLGLAASPRAISAQSVLDFGRVELTRSVRAQIGDDLLSLIVSYAKEATHAA